MRSPSPDQPRQGGRSGTRLALPTYNINFIVNPQETKSVTFKADHAGAFWLYCTHFCHALHLEMRSRFLVEA
jgi:nitrous-oxide reductase